MLLPRLIRLRDAPIYLGMDRNRFNQDVRPHLIEIPIGSQGIAFDRSDLDAWVDLYKACNGRPASKGELWDKNTFQAGISGSKPYRSAKNLTDAEFSKTLEQAIKKSKQRAN